MFNRYNKEFYEIIDDILNNEEFLKMKNIRHHGITRYHHLLRVSFYTYYISKIFHLDYKKATRASLLHDFFYESDSENENKISTLKNHPNYALENAENVFGSLSEKEKDIIKTHMFPITFTPPKYLESWIVNIIDDIAGVYEKLYSLRIEVNAATSFLMFIFISYFY